MKIEFSAVEKVLNDYFLNIQEWLLSPSFYSQIGLIFIAICIAWLLARLFRKRIPIFQEAWVSKNNGVLGRAIHKSRQLIFPILNISMLGLAREIGAAFTDSILLIVISQLLAVIFFLYNLVINFVKNPVMRGFCKWILIPIAILEVFGLLDNVTQYLESLSIEIGNIKLSAYAISRVFVFGFLLFWLGRISSNTGQRIIRNQADLDSGTKEVFVKLFQVVLTVLIFILLLQIVGINLTTLAVFGGALGVGIGFGLQSIASNFISGMIILLDRSLKIGDYVELQDGRSGQINDLNMRSATMTTFDGKDIVVPNETFITSSFVNWTHRDSKQRYPIYFDVAYGTDLKKLFTLIRDAVANHPQVISGDDVPIEERPDAEIAEFGDFGIKILVEFWMEGIDDGKNRVGADILYIIWEVLEANDIKIPFPQREVRILNSKYINDGQ